MRVAVTIAIIFLCAFASRADDGRYAISQHDLPLIITNSGSYTLTEDLTWKGPYAANGITVRADDVHIDLRGHSMIGSVTGSYDAINVDAVKNAVIENGNISYWGDDGVDASTSTGCVIRRISTSDNWKEGIQGGVASMVMQCSSMQNGIILKQGPREVGNGIKVDWGSFVSECTTVRNWAHGIQASSSSEVADCIILGNGHDGVHGGQGLLVLRTVSQDSVDNGDGVEVQGGSVVVDCISYNNDDDGMKTRNEGRSIFINCTSGENFSDGLNAGANGCIFLGCTAVNNRDDGFAAVGRGTVLDSLAAGNGFLSGDGGGINVKDKSSGTRNRVEGNHVVGNNEGIRADDSTGGGDPTFNLFVKNSAVDNTPNYNINATDNRLGPLATDPATAGPWDNFSF